MAFRSEKELMEKAIESNFIKEMCQTPCYFKTEQKGPFGIPDLVIANVKESENGIKPKMTFAFEMKLSNWKRALVQAFRYRSFADFVFVMIDESKASPAILNKKRFIDANIGLLTINERGCVKVYYHPIEDVPYSDPLKLKFFDLIKETYETSEHDTSGEWIM